MKEYPPFSYQNGRLWCEQVDLRAVVNAVGTPVYVYSQSEMQARAHAYRNGPGHAHYAVKANGNIHLLRLLASWGLGADVTSGGELYLAQQAGFAGESIIFSGVGKTAAEIRMALAAGVATLHAESAAEVTLIEKIAAELGVPAPVGVRLNPNISAETHPYISTGMHRHKFGVPVNTGLELMRYAHQSPHLQPAGIACHLGSQIHELAPFAEAAALLVEIADELTAGGISVRYIDVGGGLGVDYLKDLALRDDAHTSIAAWIETVSTPLLGTRYSLIMEPGRSIVGPAGILITEVIRTKQQPEKRFVVVDAGMNDLVRPTLYDAYHQLQPLTQPDSLELPGSKPVDVVGPICESGDFLARGRSLPALQAGELLAVMDAGAYGFAMSSNYNGRLRPAEVLVNGREFTVIRRRQTHEHLLDGC